MLKSFQIHTYENGTLGLHLTRAPWDPYPWISSIQTGSSAYAAGLRIGDTVLEFNSCDILGLKISEIALLLKSHWLQDTRVNGNTNNSKDNNSETDNDDNCHCVTMVVWRNETQASVVHETHNKDCNAKDQDAENNAVTRDCEAVAVAIATVVSGTSRSSSPSLIRQYFKLVATIRRPCGFSENLRKCIMRRNKNFCLHVRSAVY
uniref:PDZ domain-containing protein n=1 Tax=Glossina pallidipes TaxID=7398 RepID=A0A1A9ZZS0_GLOPL